MLNDGGSAHPLPKYGRQYSLEHSHSSGPYSVSARRQAGWGRGSAWGSAPWGSPPFDGRLRPRPSAAPASTPQMLFPPPDPSSPTSPSWCPAAPWPPQAGALTRGGRRQSPSRRHRGGRASRAPADSCAPCRPLSSSPLVRVKEEPPSPPRSPQVELASPGRLSPAAETPLSPATLIDSILRESEPAPATSAVATPLPEAGARPTSPPPPSAPEKCLSVACLDK